MTAGSIIASLLWLAAGWAIRHYFPVAPSALSIKAPDPAPSATPHADAVLLHLEALAKAEHEALTKNLANRVLTPKS